MVVKLLAIPDQDLNKQLTNKLQRCGASLFTITLLLIENSTAFTKDFLSIPTHHASYPFHQVAMHFFKRGIRLMECLKISTG